MKRFYINEFEKVASEDINDLQSVIHQSLYDKVLYPLFNKEDGVLNDGFEVAKDSSTTVSVKAGRAFMYDSSESDPYKPKYKSIQLGEDIILTVGLGTWSSGPANPNSRIDIICIQPLDEVVAQSTRWVKTAGVGPITESVVDKIVEQTYDIQVVEGTASLTPVVPATPAGWLKIAEVTLTGASGIVNATDVADSRNVLTPSAGLGGLLQITNILNGSVPVDSNSTMSGNLFLFDTSSGPITFNLPAPLSGLSFKFKDKTGDAATNPITLVRFGTEKIEDVAASYVLDTPFGYWEIFSDGTDWYLK